MRPRLRVAVVLAVLVFGTAGAAMAAGPSSPASGAAAVAHPPSAAQTTALHRPLPDNGSVVIRINVTPSGDARWTVASGIALADDSEEAAFRSLLADVRNGTAPGGAVGYSTETYQYFADSVERSVNRSADMRVENAEWGGRVVNSTGVISLSFTWTDFAHTDGNRVVLGDVFETGEGWFSRLGADQRLVIDRPEGYELDSSELAEPFDDGTFTIEGPTNLSAKNIRIVYEPTVPPTDTPTPSPNGSGVDPDGEGGSGIVLLGGLLVLAIAAALVAYVVSNDPFGSGGVGSVGGSDDGTTAAAAGADGSPTGDDAPAAGDGGAAGPASGTDGTADVALDPETTAGGDDGVTAEGGSAAATAEASAEDGDDVDTELLSDEERVERLLEANGGRMKQANIVTETGWSNAKVSQLLSSMDDDDRIDKLRIGRENLISLPDEDAGEIE